jgi:hypothetical protein
MSQTLPNTDQVAADGTPHGGHPHGHSSGHPHGRLIGLVAGIVAIQALVLFWFAWPAQKTAPHDLPVVVAGPAPAATALADRLRTARPGAFAITTAPDAAAADGALRDRRAYAAFVITASGPSLHIASAASPTAAALLTQAAQQVGTGAPVPVVDVVAAPADDPRGAAFAGGFLPLLLTSIIAGAGLALAGRARWAVLAALIGYGLAAGLVAAGVQHSMGLVSGTYLAEAGADGLLALAIAATTAGLAAVLGRAGVALGAPVMFVFGNPISAVASAPELLPQPWGAIGQLLPPGAGVTLLRSVAFFDGAGAAKPLWVLGCWAAAGLLLVTVRRRAPA